MKTMIGTTPRTPMARWSPSLAGLPALSVRQPWAWLIVSGFKDIENRPRRTLHRGPLLIHAGLSTASFTEEVAAWLKQRHGVRIPRELDVGGIVGVVEVVDCVEKHPSPWFEKGGFGYVLANPRRLPNRSKGVLAFAEHVLLNAARLWTEFSSDLKQRLQKVLFPEGVTFANGEFGTAVTCPLFNLLEKPEGEKSSLATLTGFEPF